MCIILGGLVALSRVMTFNQYKLYVQNLTKGDKNISIEVLGDVKLKLAPPTLVFNDTSISYKQRYMLKARTVEIPIGLSQIMNSDMGQISKVTFDTGVANLKILQAFYENYRVDLSGALQAKQLIFRNFNYTSEEHTKFNNNNGTKIQTLTIKNHNKKYNYEINCLVRNIPIVLTGTLDNRANIDDAPIHGRITSKYFNITFAEGSTTSNTKASRKTSQPNKQLVIDIYDLPTFYNAFVLGQNVNIDMNNKVDKEHSSGSNGDVAQSTPLNFTADLKMTDGLFSLNNMQITSKAVNNFMGYLSVKKSGAMVQYYVNIAVDKIDTTCIKNLTKTSTFWNNILYVLNNNFDVAKLQNISGKAKINIKNVVQADGSMTNIVVDAIDLPEAKYLNKLKVSMPGETSLSGNAILHDNPIRPKLECNVNFAIGDMKAFANWSAMDREHAKFLQSRIKSFQSTSTVSIMPYHISIDDIKFKTDSVGRSSGKVQLTHQDVYLFWDGGNIDLDRLQLSKYYDDYITILHDSDSDVSGQTYFDKTNDYRWLRSMKAKVALNLNFNEVLFKGVKLHNFYSDASIWPNQLSINTLKFDSDPISADIKLAFSLPLFRPYIETVINIRQMNYKQAAELMPKFDEGTQNDPMNRNINLFSAANYDAKVDVSGGNIQYNDKVALDNLKSSISLLDGEFDIQGLEYDVYNGTVKALANITLSSGVPQLDLTFSAANIDQNQLFSSFFGIDKFSGYVSFAGLLHATGLTPSDFIRSANGTVNFSCKNVKYSGFDLDSIIKTTDDTSSAVHSKIAVLNYYSKYGDTFFDAIRGSINIKSGLARIGNTSLYNTRLTGAYAANFNMLDRNVKSILQISFLPVGYYNRVITIRMNSEGNLNNIRSNFDFNELYTYIGYDPKKDANENENARKSNTPLRAMIIVLFREEEMNSTQQSTTQNAIRATPTTNTAH